MATKRKYAYYLKGNKLAIIEENTGSGVCSLSGYSNQTTCEAAGGTWTQNAFADQDNEYKSPVADIEDGIELQYAYSPTYKIPDQSSSEGVVSQQSKIFLNGWISVGGYLTFVASGTTWSSYSQVVANEHILIDGSSRWNGIHKIQEIQAYGDDVVHSGIKTYTKVPEGDLSITDAATVWNDSNNTITSLGAYGLEDTFVDSTETPYLWISGSGASALNNGLFGGWSASITTLDLSSATRYSVSALGVAGITSTREATADANLADDTEASVIYKAYREPGLNLTTKIEVMSGSSAEDFEIDLNRYQANAIVYYLKAKLAEDRGEFDLREHFLREFKKQMERASGAFKGGSYIAQGFKQMR